MGSWQLDNIALRKTVVGVGHVVAPIVWLYLASLLPPGQTSRSVITRTAWIAEATGLSERSVHRALVILAESSALIRIRQPTRHGQIYVLRVTAEAPNPGFLWPTSEQIIALRSMAGKVRDIQAGIVMLGIGFLVAASHEVGSSITGEHQLEVSLAQIRELLALSLGGSFASRLDDLARTGVIRRVGEAWSDGVIVTCPIRALRSFTPC